MIHEKNLKQKSRDTVPLILRLYYTLKIVPKQFIIMATIYSRLLSLYFFCSSLLPIVLNLNMTYLVSLFLISPWPGVPALCFCLFAWSLRSVTFPLSVYFLSFLCISSPESIEWFIDDQAQGADRHPPSSTRGEAGRNHLNEEITPVIPTGIGERF